MSSDSTNLDLPDATPVICYCDSGKVFGSCCGPLLSGETVASTAVALMRSRYSAFATGNCMYLERTWHPDTRPDQKDILDPEVRWTSLQVIDSSEGSAFHQAGTVTFEASFVNKSGPARAAKSKRAEVLRETSNFVRHNRLWVYFGAQ